MMMREYFNWLYDVGRQEEVIVKMDGFGNVERCRTDNHAGGKMMLICLKKGKAAEIGEITNNQKGIANVMKWV